jgi:hypothetical protein
LFLLAVPAAFLAFALALDGFPRNAIDQTQVCNNLPEKSASFLRPCPKLLRMRDAKIRLLVPVQAILR